MNDNFDDFNFSDSDMDLDGFSDDDSLFGDSSGNQSNNGNDNDDSDNEFGNFGNDTDTNDSQTADSVDRVSMIKQCAIILAVAIMLIVIAFTIISKATGKGKNKTDDAQQIMNNNQSQIVQQAGNGTSNNGWSKLTDKPNISFNQDLITTSFTITDIKHYAKVVDNDKNLIMKTVLTGSLDGFTGTYEIEVPYSKGYLLSIGSHFNVYVGVGEYKGKRVVGEISY